MTGVLARRRSDKPDSRVLSFGAARLVAISLSALVALATPVGVPAQAHHAAPLALNVLRIIFALNRSDHAKPAKKTMS